MDLMEAVVERENLKRAYARVVRNKGAAGVDKMSVGELKAYLQVHWPRIKEELLAGGYQPLLVRKVSIPKRNGKGERILGIPTVTDRLLQGEPESDLPAWPGTPPESCDCGAHADPSGLDELLL